MKLPIKGTYPPDWNEIGDRVRAEAGGICIRCGHDHDPKAGYALTVHHFDGNKSNCEWWNLMALCQRCHLRRQGMRPKPMTKAEALRRLKLRYDEEQTQRMLL